jgi:hypothetical protein
MVDVYRAPGGRLAAGGGLRNRLNDSLIQAVTDVEMVRQPMAIVERPRKCSLIAWLRLQSPTQYNELACISRPCYEDRTATNR